MQEILLKDVIELRNDLLANYIAVTGNKAFAAKRGIRRSKEKLFQLESKAIGYLDVLKKIIDYFSNSSTPFYSTTETVSRTINGDTVDVTITTRLIKRLGSQFQYGVIDSWVENNYTIEDGQQVPNFVTREEYHYDYKDIVVNRIPNFMPNVEIQKIISEIKDLINY